MAKNITKKFITSQRHHVPSWIICKIADLLEKAKRIGDSSNVLYACLEARNLLENISSTKLLCSVPAEEREKLRQVLKPQRGINTVDKELRSLGLKTQEFLHVVSSESNFPIPVFQFAHCKILQDELSQYVHNYTIEESDMVFGSKYIRDGIEVVNKAVKFAKDNMHYDAEGNFFQIGNMDMTNLPDWGKELLADWKSGSGKVRTLDELRAAVQQGSQEYIASVQAEE